MKIMSHSKPLTFGVFVPHQELQVVDDSLALTELLGGCGRHLAQGLVHRRGVMNDFDHYSWHPKATLPSTFGNA